MKRILIAVLTLFLGLLTAPTAQAATTLTNAASTNPVYVEDGAEVLIGQGITFTNETSFSGGYFEFAVGSAASSDILNLQKVSTAVITSGVISVVGGTIYKGDGTTANPVASIDATYDGSAGKSLRIRFSSSFTNASFETGDFTGWEYFNTRVDIGVTTLAGVVSNDDENFYPDTCSGSSLNDNDAPASASYNYEFSTSVKTNGTRSLRLFSSMTTKFGGDIVHGPAVVSSEFTAAANDVISFDWQAQNGGDDFDVYGYLINSATGAQIEVIDANGSATTWATKSTTIPTTGNYRFVFINGTHDLSCGLVAGGSLYIDNIQVVGASATAELAQSIARLVTYKSTSNNPAATRTVTLSATPATGTITPLSLTVDITAVDDGPVPSDISISYTDTTATDDFTASTGTISANDPDGGSGGGSTTYGISGGISATGSTSKVGSYGTLTVNESTGAYSFEPNDSAINAAVINVSETFTITAQSGSLTGAATLTVSITGAAESSVAAPTISGISPSRGPVAGGTTVTITGSGFLTAQFVKFGPTFGTNVVIVSNTSLTVQAPAKLAGTYNVTVINDGGTNSGTNNFVYYIPAAPIAPTSVTATGGNASAGISWTASEDATSYIVTSTPGSLTCTTSSTSCTISGLTNGTPYTFRVVASNTAGNSSASTASSAVTPLATDPTVSSVLPGSGVTTGGITVTITGSQLTGTTSVTFGGIAATNIVVVSDTQITVTNPANAEGEVVVVVTTISGSDVDAKTFSYTPTAATIAARNAAAAAAAARAEAARQAAANQALAQRIDVQAIPSPNPGSATGPISVNGLSPASTLFVAPEAKSTIPGFSSLRVLGNSIEVVPTPTFSGRMTVPVTIIEGGATVTLNIPIIVNPKPVPAAATTPVSRTATSVTWEPSPNAVSYKVVLNNQELCTSSTTSCSIPKILGPRSKMEVITLGNDGTVSSQVLPAYIPSKPIPVLDVKFGLGSSTITRSEIRKLRSFVSLMNEQGFTRVAITAFTDGVGGIAGAKSLSSARAQSVARFLDRFLNVELKPSAKGISPNAKGSRPDANSRKAEVAVQ